MLVRNPFFVLLSLLLLNTGQLFSQSETSQKASPQKGFIINYGGDTISGIIEIPLKDGLSRSVYFKPRNERRKLLNSFDIAGFGNSATTRIYKSFEIPLAKGPELSFIRVLMEGKYSLLYYNSIKSKHYLIKGPDGRITDLNGIGTTNDMKENFQSAFKTAFSEIPEILDNSDRVKSNKKSLTRLLQGYYEDKMMNYEIHSGVGRSYSLGIIAGTSFDRFNPGKMKTTFNSHSTLYPYGGLSVYSSNKFSGRSIFLQSTLGVKSYHYYYSVAQPYGTEYFESFIRSFYATAKAGLSFESVSQRTIKPFFEFGPAALFLSSPEYENYYDIISLDNTVGLSAHYHDRLQSTNYFGAFFKTGISHDLPNQNSVRLSAGVDLLRTKGGAGISSADIAIVYYFKIR